VRDFRTRFKPVLRKNVAPRFQHTLIITLRSSQAIIHDATCQNPRLDLSKVAGMPLAFFAVILPRENQSSQGFA